MTSENESLGVQVFTTLKNRIMRWEYPPGHRLIEEALSEEFEVSRSPVREALRMLVENDYVEKTPYRGYSVKQLDLDEIWELYDVRLALELFAVEHLAAADGTPEALNDLQRIWQDLLSDLPSSDVDMAARDEAFHELLAAATGNRALRDTLHSINERLRFVRLTDFLPVERRRETCQQHLRILAAILAGDAQSARRAMQENIEMGRQNVEAAVKESLANAYLKSSASPEASE